MPRYFFDRIGDVQDPDHEGLELHGLDQVRREAVQFTIDTLKDARFSLWPGGGFRIDVSDGARQLVFSIAVSTTPDAAPRGEAAAE